MEKIKFYENFLDQEFITKLKNNLYSKVGEQVWMSSLAWHESIRKSSSLVVIKVLDKDKYIYNYIKKKYQNLFPKFKNKKLKLKINYYVWPKLSYIPFHKDVGHFVASTIYLNENWNEDYGGLFLYKENNEIKAVAPKYNLAVVNFANISHGTSLTTMDAPYRETIQIFFDEIK